MQNSSCEQEFEACGQKALPMHRATTIQTKNTIDRSIGNPKENPQVLFAAPMVPTRPKIRAEVL